MSRQSGLTLSNFWFPLIVAILVGFFRISPVYLILITIAFAVYQGLKKQKL
jgi:chromate transporter